MTMIIGLTVFISNKFSLCLDKFSFLAVVDFVRNITQQCEGMFLEILMHVHALP